MAVIGGGGLAAGPTALAPRRSALLGTNCQNTSGAEIGRLRRDRGIQAVVVACFSLGMAGDGGLEQRPHPPYPPRPREWVRARAQREFAVGAGARAAARRCVQSTRTESAAAIRRAARTSPKTGVTPPPPPALPATPPRPGSARAHTPRHPQNAETAKADRFWHALSRERRKPFIERREGKLQIGMGLATQTVGQAWADAVKNHKKVTQRQHSPNEVRCSSIQPNKRVAGDTYALNPFPKPLWYTPPAPDNPSRRGDSGRGRRAGWGRVARSTPSAGRGGAGRGQSRSPPAVAGLAAQTRRGKGRRWAGEGAGEAAEWAARGWGERRGGAAGPPALHRPPPPHPRGRGAAQEITRGTREPRGISGARRFGSGARPRGKFRRAPARRHARGGDRGVGW